MKDLSLHIMDILQNSTRAKATTIQLSLQIDKNRDTITIIFQDNGCGMDPETVSKALNPFFTTRTTRDIGLGLSLLKQNAEQTGGSLSIESELNVGTTVTVTMGYSHIDCPPLGDIAGTIVLTASAYPDIRFVFNYITENSNYLFDTEEVKEVLDGISIQEPEVIQYLKEMIEENMNLSP